LNEFDETAAPKASAFTRLSLSFEKREANRCKQTPMPSDWLEGFRVKLADARKLLMHSNHFLSRFRGTHRRPRVVRGGLILRVGDLSYPSKRANSDHGPPRPATPGKTKILFGPEGHGPVTKEGSRKNGPSFISWA
jgi:hypothetical protein